MQLTRIAIKKPIMVFFHPTIEVVFPIPVWSGIASGSRSWRVSGPWTTSSSSTVNPIVPLWIFWSSAHLNCTDAMTQAHNVITPYKQAAAAQYHSTTYRQTELVMLEQSHDWNVPHLNRDMQSSVRGGVCHILPLQHACNAAHSICRVKFELYKHLPK